MRHLLVRSFLLLSLLILVSGGALAQDLMGFYFDEEATQTTIQTTTPYEEVTGYLVLKDPSFADGLRSWECVVDVRTTGPDIPIIWELEGQALNVATEPAFLVGLGQLLPSDGDILLARATMLVPQPGQDVTINIRPMDPPSYLDPPGWGYPVYAPAFGHGEEGILAPAGWASGCEIEPVAIINWNAFDNEASPGGLPETLNLGFVLPGETGEESFVLRNSQYNDAPLNGTVYIDSPAYHYLHGDGYLTQQPTSFRVEPGQHLSFTVQLQVEEEIIYGAQMIFTLCGEEWIVPLTGGYIEGECDVLWNGHDFGLVPVGGEAQRGFAVVNFGPGVLIIDPVIDDPNFSIRLSGDQTFPYTILPGHIEYVYVSFAPMEEGTWDLEIPLGTEACPPIQVMGQAQDLPPECAQDATAYDFEDVGLGQAAPTSLEFSNEGGGILLLDLTLEQSGNAFSIEPGTGLYELSPGQEMDVVIYFQPEYLGLHTAVLHTGTECAPVALQGTGRDPFEAYDLPEEVDLPTMTLGETSYRNFLITNTGETPISGDIQIAGNPAISLLNPGPFTMQPWDQQAVRLSFSPQEVGPHAAEVSTGLSGGDVVPIHAYGTEVLPGPQNILGLHFDTSYLGNEGWTTEPDEIITGYLVLHEPSTTSGVVGWEFCLTQPWYGFGEILGWDAMGYDGGLIPGDCPSVVLDEPLPPSSEMLLATVDILMAHPHQVVFYLEPAEESPLPDYPYYLDAADGQLMIPMDTDLQGYFAVINPGLVDIEDPVDPEEDEPTEDQDLPRATTLKPCYPNPFNPETNLTFLLDRDSPVQLSVFDLSGRRLRVLVDERRSAGSHQESWDGRDRDGRLQPSGVYYFRLTTDQGLYMQKGTLLK